MYAWYCLDRYVTCDILPCYGHKRCSPLSLDPKLPAWITQEQLARGDDVEFWRTDSREDMEEFVRTGQKPEGNEFKFNPGVTFGDGGDIESRLDALRMRQLRQSAVQSPEESPAPE